MPEGGPSEDYGTHYFTGEDEIVEFDEAGIGFGLRVSTFGFPGGPAVFDFRPPPVFVHNRRELFDLRWSEGDAVLAGCDVGKVLRDVEFGDLARR